MQSKNKFIYCAKLSEKRFFEKSSLSLHILVILSYASDMFACGIVLDNEMMLKFLIKCIINMNVGFHIVKIIG